MGVETVRAPPGAVVDGRLSRVRMAQGRQADPDAGGGGRQADPDAGGGGGRQTLTRGGGRQAPGSPQRRRGQQLRRS